MGTTSRLLGPWAKTKPYHPLLWHMIDAGLLARRLLMSPTFSRLGELLRHAADWPGDSLLQWVPYLVALHDIGKCDCDFQAQHPPARDSLTWLPFREIASPGFRHEARSAEMVSKHLQELRWDSQSAKTVAQVVQGHHGQFTFSEAEMPPCEQSRLAPWATLRNELAACLGRIFRTASGLPPVIRNHGTTGAILAGLLVMSDWIVSNEELFNRPELPNGACVEDYARASDGAAQLVIDRLGLSKALPFRADDNFASTWPELAGSPRPIQALAERVSQAAIVPGLTIIEAPMGEGKTEAALYLASNIAITRGHGGIYLALPTAATSNQMHARIGQWLKTYGAEQAHVRLVHGMSWLIDDATPTDGGQISGEAAKDAPLEWFQPSRRALLSPLAVGTIDQALMATLNVRFGFLRLLGLAKGVLIVDEVHAYDAYMSTIIDRLLSWCGALEVPVLLLSATLPSERKGQLIAAYRGSRHGEHGPPPNVQAYPLVTMTAGADVKTVACQAVTRKSVQVALHPGLIGDADATAALCSRLVRNGGCACVILNTVQAAQQVYECLRTIESEDTQLLLFHSRFPAGRRADIEQTALNWFDKQSLSQMGKPSETCRPSKAILVATQVVEQSLDLDFDVMITEMAPIDLLLQRMGRLHRHDRPSRPTGMEPQLHVLMPTVAAKPDFGLSERVYHRYVLLKSLSALTRHQSIAIPGDIRHLVEQVYDDEPLSFVQQWQEAGLSQSDIEGSFDDFTEQRAEFEQSARKYLIPAPCFKHFKLAEKTSAFEEDDGSQEISNFRAKTRYGDDSVRVILLDSDAFAQELLHCRPPAREILQRILLHEVPLPRWWLRHGPAEGYAPITPGPDWLGCRPVVRMIDGIWKGRSVRVSYAPDVGVAVSASP